MKDEVKDQKSTPALSDEGGNSRRELLKKSVYTLGGLYIAPATLSLLTAKQASARSGCTEGGLIFLVNSSDFSYDIIYVDDSGQTHSLPVYPHSNLEVMVCMGTYLCWSTSDDSPYIVYLSSSIERSTSQDGFFNIEGVDGIIFFY